MGRRDLDSISKMNPFVCVGEVGRKTNLDALRNWAVLVGCVQTPTPSPEAIFFACVDEKGQSVVLESVLDMFADTPDSLDRLVRTTQVNLSVTVVVARAM